MVFTKLLLENALAIRPCNCEAASQPLLPKVVRCIPVLPSRYIGKCAARVLKRSGLYLHKTRTCLLFGNGRRRPSQSFKEMYFGTSSRSSCVLNFRRDAELQMEKSYEWIQGKYCSSLLLDCTQVRSTHYKSLIQGSWNNEFIACSLYLRQSE